MLASPRATGHEVHAVTLTGDGDRAHLRHRGIKLGDHVADVVAAVQAEALQQIVPVVHSYGGMVITGAADRLLQVDPRAVGALVYVDAMVPLPGESWGEQHSAEVIAARTAAAQENDHALPPPDPVDFGITGADREWLLRRQVPHPFGPYRDPLHFDAVRWAALPRTFIDCTQPAYPTIAAMRERVRRMPGFRVVEMATARWSLSPRRWSALLLRAAGRAPMSAALT